MKRIILCVVIFSLFIISSSQAQESRYGVRVGGNLSSITSDDISKEYEDGRIGLVMGFLAEFALTEKLGLQPEFQYSAQGNKDEILNVNYLQLPVFLKYNFTETFNIHLGPQAGIKIWEWEDNKVNPNQINDANFNTFDFAAVGGIGVNIAYNFFIDIRYAFGLTNILEDEGVQKGFDAKSTNIQFSVGYRL